MTSSQKRARLRLIRRQALKRAGLPIRRGGGGRRRREFDDTEGRDLDTPNPDLIGFTEDL